MALNGTNGIGTFPMLVVLAAFAGACADSSTTSGTDAGGGTGVGGTDHGGTDAGGGTGVGGTGVGGNGVGGHGGEGGVCGDALWSKCLANPDDTYVNATALGGDRNFLVTGSFGGTLDLGGSPLVADPYVRQIFLAKLDLCGGHLWSKSFGGADQSSQFATALATDPSGSILLTGGFTGQLDFGGGPLAATSSPDLWEDIFIVKLDAQSHHVWSKAFGDFGPQAGLSVVASGTGNVLFGGRFSGTIDLGGGPLSSTQFNSNDMFVAKLGPAGAHLWSRRFGGAMGGSIHSVAFADDERAVLAGSFAGTVDFGGGPLTAVGFAGFVAALDIDGDHVWSVAIPTTQSVGAVVVAAHESGPVVVATTFEGSVEFGGDLLESEGGKDIFLGAIASNGAPLWARRFGDSADQEVGALTSDSQGNLVLTGAFSGSVDFGGGPLESEGTQRMFVAELDLDGNHLESRGVGEAPGYYVPTIVAADGPVDLLVGGGFSGSLDLGSGVLTASDSSDAFLARMR
jgi:hypothetical protein